MPRFSTKHEKQRGSIFVEMISLKDLYCTSSACRQDVSSFPDADTPNRIQQRRGERCLWAGDTLT